MQQWIANTTGKAASELMHQKVKDEVDPITFWEYKWHQTLDKWRQNGNSGRFYFLELQNQCTWWLQPWNWMMFAPWKKSYAQPRQHIKMQRHYYFADKGLSSQSYGFSSSHVWMWELDHKEGWAPKNWYFWTVVLVKTLESPLDSMEIKPVDFKGNLVPNIHWKDWCWSWSSKTLATCCEELTHLRRPWCWERLRAGGEGDDRGWNGWMASPTQWTWVWVDSGSWWWKGDLACCGSWGNKELDTTEWLTWTDWKDQISMIRVQEEVLWVSKQFNL